MTTIRTLIIDDEPLARDLVRNYLKDYPEISIVGECEDGFSGLKAIKELQPELVFLDVQMPKLTGFEMLEVMDSAPLIIFTTAYDQYALQAFEKNAVDYLLKPFSRDRLRAALHKAMEKLSKNEAAQENVEALKNNLPPKEEKLERVVVKSGTKVKVIPSPQLLYLEAQDDYVMLYTEEGKYLKQQTMKYFEEHLDPATFIRVHRSYILNIDYMGQIEPFEKDSYRIVLKNKAVLPVSRSGYSRLKEKLGF